MLLSARDKNRTDTEETLDIELIGETVIISNTGNQVDTGNRPSYSPLQDMSSSNTRDVQKPHCSSITQNCYIRPKPLRPHGTSIGTHGRDEFILIHSPIQHSYYYRPTH